MIWQQELICRTQNSHPQTEPIKAKHTAVIFLLCLSDTKKPWCEYKQLTVKKFIVGGRQYTCSAYIYV